ncbi:MAG: hypothetical protein SFU98_20530 [Leptospiraceae bacterium]|nr:hypothetical protein [Leptospiraceae bacterium]
MKKILLIVLVIFTLALLAEDYSEDDSAEDNASDSHIYSAEELSKEFLIIHNAFRAKFKVPPVTWDSRIADYAQE